MRAAALVLLVARLAVLVGADRDVLGAVVGGELGATQRDRSGSERRDRGDDLSRGRGQALRAAGDLGDRRAGDHRRQHAGPLERELHAGEPATRAREQRDRLRETGRPAKERVRDLGRAEALELGRDLEPSVGQADRASPRIRAVHEHAVRERHPAESDRFFGHALSVAASSSPGPHTAGSRRRAPDRPRWRARSPSGRAALRAADPCSAAGRTRTRRSRTRRASSGCP